MNLVFRSHTEFFSFNKVELLLSSTTWPVAWNLWPGALSMMGVVI